MKRKILFVAVIMALLACIFAITAYASEIPEWTSITEVAGMPDKSVFGNDGKSGATSRVLMSDGITYPAYYICKNSTSLGISFSDLNTKTGKSYEAVDVVRIEIPNGAEKIPYLLAVSNGYTALATVVIPEGVTTIESSAFSGKDDSNHSSLVSVTIPSTVTTIGEKAFYCCNSLEELVLPEGLTAIPTNMAYHAYSLKYVNIPSTVVSIGELAFRANSLLSCEIVIPEGCTTIGASVFKGTGVTSVTLPSTLESLGKEIFSECPALTSVNSKSPIIGVQMFYHCNELSTIKLENTIEIGNLAFNNSNLSKVSSLELPEGLTTIGEYAFPRMSITSVVIPSTVVNIGQKAFTENESLEKAVVLGPVIGTGMFYNCSALRTLVLTENFETFGADALVGVPQDSFTTYYTGTDYERIKTLCSNSTRFSAAGNAEYIGYGNDKYTEKTYMVVWGANLCEVAFDGNHEEDSNPCVINCDRCGMSEVAEENPVHTDSVSIVYANGYHMEGAKITGCANEGCKHSTSVSFPAIFNCLGYSTKESGTGIATGFSVNYDVLDEYKEIEGGNIKFGMVVFNPSYIGDTFFDENGKINATIGAIQVEFNQNYASFNASVAGFDLSNVAHQNLELVFAGYSYTKADKSDIKLFQKEYTVGTPELPNYSPMQSKVTKGDSVAYTVKIQTVTTPALVTTGKDGLDEYGA